MKLIIDIPDYNLNDIQNGSIACSQILKAVKNGKPYDERPQDECCGCCYLCDVSDCGADMKGGAE